MSVSSPSPSPDDPNDFQIPDDSLIVQYPNLDPSEHLENPGLVYGDARELFYAEPMDEKMGGMLVQVLENYRDLANTSFDTSLSIVKHNLQNGTLKHKDAYDILDKFYNDYPDALTIPGSFLSVDHLNLFAEKLKLHDQCEKSLKTFAEIVEKVKTERVGDSNESEEEDEESDDEVPVKRRKKPRRRKKKGKTSDE
jgi:hypothetical protein